MPLQANKRTYGLRAAIFLFALANRAESQQHGIHGPRWGFAVASAVSKDVRHPRLTQSWTSNEDLDSVWIVMGRSHTAPVDSIRLSIRSGPSRLMSETDAAAASFRSDSIGEWVNVPSGLLRSGGGERNVPMPMLVLGAFSPTAIESWARAQNPNRPVVTRIAAQVWRRKTYERAELYLENGSVAKPKTLPRKKLSSPPPSRN